MKLSNLLSNYTTDALSSSNSIAALKQYVSARVDDLRTFVSGQAQCLSVTIHDEAANISKVAMLTADQYASALDNSIEQLELTIDDAGNTITVTADEVIEAVESQASDMQAQESFLSYCINAGDTCNASDWLTQVNTTYSGISSTIKSRYASFLEGVSNPIVALQRFCASFKMDEITNENTYISIVTIDDYQGSAWTSAWTKISNTVAGFFSGVWKGIKQIGTFFAGVLSGLVKLGRFLLCKLFPDLSTAYVIESNSVYGVLDLPIFQCRISVAKHTMYDFVRAWEVNLPYHGWYSYSHYNLKGRRDFPLTDHSKNTLVEDCIAASLWRLSHQNIGEEEQEVATVSEVFLPKKYASTRFNFVLRFGWASDTEFVMSLHVSMTGSAISGLSDNDVAFYIRESLRALLMYTDSIVPMFPTPLTTDDTSVQFNELTDEIMVDTGVANASLPDRLKMFNVLATRLNDNQKRIIASLGLLAAVMTNKFTWAATSGTGVFTIETPSEKVNAFGFLENYEIGPDEAGIISTIELDSVTTGTLYDEGFRPYQLGDVSPTSVHYQTTQEQADEILALGLRVAGLLAITVGTVKFRKWKKKRNLQTKIQQVALNEAARTVALNPTAENYRAYSKLSKKMRKISRLNSILGIDDSAQSTTKALTSHFDDITEMINAGNAQTTADGEISSLILKSIRGTV